MEQDEFKVENFSRKELANLAMDMFHRTIVHHVFWFKEVEHQMGFDRALEIMDSVYERNKGVQLKRLSKLFDFKLVDGIPEYLLEMPKERLLEVIENVGLNWLALEGIWFQEVEFKHGMLDAKRCGDSCWAWFSPFEAWSVRKLLDLPADPGIEGLKKALQLRLYARIGVQTIIEESPNSIVLQMNDCRVQTTRKRKGLNDYPCKSAGIVEHTNFARSIDSRIKTECVACPPDEHPVEWYCAWRFSIENL
jgi:hypothetical protein